MSFSALSVLVCASVWRAATIIVHSTIPYFNPPRRSRDQPRPVKAISTCQPARNIILLYYYTYYITLHTSITVSVRCLRKIQPLEVLLLLSCSWKYMGQDMASLFPLSAKICVVDVYCTLCLLYDVMILNVIHRSGALNGLFGNTCLG